MAAPEAPDGPQTPPPPPPDGDSGGAAPPAPAPRPANCEARAAAAEARASQLEIQLAELQAQLDTSRRTAAEADRARELQALLIQARAIDLDAATLLVGQAINGADAPDLAAAVRELRRRKPHLFRSSPQSSSMSPRPSTAPGPDADADDLAELAATTGDRRALLRYLRARRR